ncbi:unnamed protein product [Adineta ricciae]|uniref:Cytochrome P450 n=1 Tax=Adineta ricciae TaxID=249248 RepID=A0A814FXF6_ADIRI|nr:unnamed protein product [Adineta ricciae]CAF1556107.1 unnamed protein product [Adineta ricciae]
MMTKHGLIYFFNLGQHLRLVIQDLENLSDILGRVQAERFYQPVDSSFRLKLLIGTQNLFHSNDKEHERARKMLNPAFHFDNLQSMISIMIEHTQKTIDTCLEYSFVANITNYLNKLTLSIIVSNTLGTDFGNHEIRDQALTFILAGHETTSNLMSWITYELVINSTVCHDCQDEVDRVLSYGLPLTYVQLNQPPIIEMVSQETLRLHLPAPFFARQCIKEQIIGKTSERLLRIPKGLTILANAYAIR